MNRPLTTWEEEEERRGGKGESFLVKVFRGRGEKGGEEAVVVVFPLPPPPFLLSDGF